MVQWHSPEEAEAWWSELQGVKNNVQQLEQRLVDIAKDLYKTYLRLFPLSSSKPSQKDYLWRRVKKLSDKIDSCQKEDDIKKIIIDFSSELDALVKSEQNK